MGAKGEQDPDKTVIVIKNEVQLSPPSPKDADDRTVILVKREIQEAERPVTGSAE